MKFDITAISKAIKFETLVRQLYARAFSAAMPFYIVNEYPKSGGTWIGLMLADALDVPFPRHRVPKFESSILHGHYLHPYGMRNVVSVWRDGRDVMVSWYHHCLYEAEHGNERLVNIVKKDLAFKDRDDIVNNLPAFIEYAFEKQRHPSFSWAQFVDVWHLHPNAVPVKYEDFKSDGVAVLMSTVMQLAKLELDPIRAQTIVDKYSFANMSGRSAGEENKSSFMRKGIVGDWQSLFNHTSREMFAHYAGEQLVKLGYESDLKWVNQSEFLGAHTY